MLPRPRALAPAHPSRDEDSCALRVALHSAADWRVMLTDTALFRNPHYHQKTDTIETLDIEKMALVIEALAWGLVEF